MRSIPEILTRSSALAVAAFLYASASLADSVTIPNTFVGGTPAVAGEVNQNFDAVASAINDNDARIDVIEGAKQVRLTADSLNPRGSTSRSNGGFFGQAITFPQVFTSSVGATFPLPIDWDGVSDFVITLFFTPDDSNAGVVDFFARVHGVAVGDTIADVTGVAAQAPISVSGENGVLLASTIVAPASRFALTDDLFVMTIQRNVTNDTYTSAVSLIAVGITYQ